MILLPPIFIFRYKFSNRPVIRLPFAVPTGVRSPTNIGVYARLPIYQIIFKQINFASQRPFPAPTVSASTSRPDSRPCSHCRRNLGSDEHSSFPESIIFCNQAARSILSIFTILFPVATSSFIIRILYPFLFSCNYQCPVFTNSIFFLIPLQFLITLEAFFPTPYIPVRFSRSIKFIMKLQNQSFFRRFRCIIGIRHIFRSFFIFSRFYIGHIEK